jgi:hypothetical protein
MSEIPGQSRHALPATSGPLGAINGHTHSDVDGHDLGNYARKWEGRALTKSIAAEPLSDT